VHEVDRDQPKTMKELLDIPSSHASGKEAVRAIFIQGDGKAAPGAIQGAPLKAAGKGTKGDKGMPEVTIGGQSDDPNES
jgi:hypothetical protein